MLSFGKHFKGDVLYYYHEMSLTSPSMHWFSLMAPQHPRKPTTMIISPTTMKMYAPGIESYFKDVIIQESVHFNDNIFLKEKCTLDVNYFF